MRKRLIIIIAFLLIGSFLAPAETEKREISLKDAIFHALKNNLDLQVQMTDAEMAEKTLKINKAIFIPTLELTGTARETNQPATGFLSGSAEIDTANRLQLVLALDQQTPLGGVFHIEFDGRRAGHNSKYDTLRPGLTSIATLRLTQPLLKNFGLTPTKRQIHIAGNNLKIAKHQLKENIINLVYTVEEAYWNLVHAHQNLEATKMALKRAKDLLRQNEIKVRVGSAAPIEILTAKAEVARNDSLLIQAERTIQTAEENLKKILNMSKETYALFPSDKPQIKKIDVDFDKFLLEGLNNRPDVDRAKLDLANQRIGVKFAKNQMLPELGITANYWVTGQGGTEWDYYKSPVDPTFDMDTDMYILGKKSFGKAWEDVFKNLYKNYNIALNLKIPLSFSKEKAELAQAKINLKKSLLGLKNVENTVYSEVKEVIKELEANAKLVEADKIALELEGQKLRAEERRLAVGLTTNIIVLDFQRQYAESETRALRSVIDYNMTLARINKILARTFKVYDIKLKEFFDK